MTRIGKRIVKCIKCGTESEQLVIYSVNFNLGSKESNEMLMNHLQECPNCRYKAVDISRKN